MKNRAGLGAQVSQAKDRKMRRFHCLVCVECSAFETPETMKTQNLRLQVGRIRRLRKDLPTRAEWFKLWTS